MEEKYTRQEVFAMLSVLSNEEYDLLKNYSFDAVYDLFSGDPENFEKVLGSFREMIQKDELMIATLEKMRDELQIRREQAEEEAKKPKERPSNPLLQDYYGKRSTTHSYYRRNMPWI